MPVSDPFGSVPRRIGRYEIVDLLGEGGMGRVYRAKQEQPERFVALKVIRSNLAAGPLKGRLRREAELLGRLNHPGICRIYEAGTTAIGEGGEAAQPFVAMELIEGRPLLEYAREEDLDLESRLELLAKLCDALQHAHQNGVIHRDLKSANVLVEATGQPKILDFGLGQLPEQELRATRYTATGQLVGTIAYMSPEQAAGKEQLDTRSDVYSLGVLGYELLAERPPYELEGQHIARALRVIESVEPESLGEVDPKLEGDIETIIGTALEKERDRRYQSAHEMATDIRRHLRNEPILARPPSGLYVFRKFVRRNREIVAGVVLAFVLLALGLAGTGYGLLQARQRAAEAESERQTAVKAEKSARREAERSNLVRDFFLEVLIAPAPEKGGREIKMIDALEYAAEQVKVAFVNEPRLEAAVHAELGTTYYRLGEFGPGVSHARKALDMRREQLGPDHVETHESMSSLGSMLIEAPGEWDVDGLSEGAELIAGALEGARRLLGPEDPETLTRIANLAAVRRKQGRYPEAETLFRQVIEVARPWFDDGNPFAIESLKNLASLLERLGRYEEAEELLLESLSWGKQLLAEDAPVMSKARRNLADVYRAQSRSQDAVLLYRQVLVTQTKSLGENHPEVLVTMNNMAFTLLELEEYEEGASIYEDILRRAKFELPDDHMIVMIVGDSLARALHRLGRLEEAEAQHRQGVQEVSDGLGPVAALAIGKTDKFALFLVETDRAAEAEVIARERIALVGDTADLEARGSLTQLGSSRALALLALGRRSEAGAELDRLIGEMASLSSLSATRRSQILDRIGELASKLGRRNEVEELRRSTLPPELLSET